MPALEELLTNENQPRGSRLEAEGFLKKLQQLEVVILLELWDTHLAIFQKTSSAFQESGLLLISAVQLLNSLLEFVKSHISLSQYYEEKGMVKSVVKSTKNLQNAKKTETAI